MIHTYAILNISREAYEEIKTKLEAADYGHAFHKQDGRIVIDMHGIALAAAVNEGEPPRRGNGP
jgi:hypothetical protein